MHVKINSNVCFMKVLRPLILGGLFFLCTCQFIFGTSYTWTGSTNNNWTTTSNWSPSGTPGIYDIVTVVSRMNNIILTSNVTVLDLILTSDTIECNSFSLNVSGNLTITTGLITNGNLIVNGAGTSTFNGGVVNVKTKITCNSFYLKNVIFNDSLFIVKKGNTGNVSFGGNHFSSFVSIIDSATSSYGSIVLQENLPDTFLNKLYIRNNSTGTLNNSGAPIQVSHGVAGSYFADDVIFEANTGNIVCGAFGSCTFNGNVYLSNGTSGILGLGTGNTTLTISQGHSIFTGTLGFNSNVAICGVIQQEAAMPINLVLPSTKSLNLKNNQFNSPFSAQSGTILIQNNVFNEETNLVKIGNLSTTNCGNNIFNKKLTLRNNSSVNYSLGVTTDVFNGVAKFISDSTGSISLNNSVFSDSLYIINNSLGSTGFSLAGTGNFFYSGPYFFLENHNSAFTIGSGGGSTLFYGQDFQLANNCSGSISIRNGAFEQPTPFVVIQPGLTRLTLGPNNNFYQKFLFDGPSLTLNSNYFADSVIIKRTSTIAETHSGGNIYYSYFQFTDSASSSHTTNFCSASLDTYYSDVKLIQKGNSTLNISVNFPSFISGNLIVDCANTGGIKFGNNNGGRTIFNGNGLQNYNAPNSLPVFKHLWVDKSNSYLKLNSPLTITDSLVFVKGNIATDSINLFTFIDNAKVKGGGETCFFAGPVKKIGNDQFLFPLGSDSLDVGSRYHPLEISAPSSASDTFVAEYRPSSVASNSVFDTTEISLSEYWKLKYLGPNTSSSVQVTLYWNANSTMTDDELNLLVANYDGTTVGNLGQSGLLRTGSTGKISTLGTTSISSGSSLAFTLANLIPVYYATLRRTPDGGCYSLRKNKIYFKFLGEYASKNLSYKIYGDDHVRTLSIDCPSFPSLLSQYGDNRFHIDLSTCTSGQLASGKKFTLEVENEKKEKFYLRFRN